MLAARQVGKTCLLCRYGLLAPARQQLARSVAMRSTTLHTRRPRLEALQQASTRSFSTSRPGNDDPAASEFAEDPETVTEELYIRTEPREEVEGEEYTPEAVVREARQTFGNTLPAHYLTKEEFQLYQTLYGNPLRPTTAEDLEFVDDVLPEEEEVPAYIKNYLLRENEAGEFEEIEFDPADSNILEGALSGIDSIDHTEHNADEGVEAFEYESEVRVQARNQRELDAIMQLKKDMEIAAARAADEEARNPVREEEEEQDEDEDLMEEEDLEEDYDADDYEPGESLRAHPNTRVGRWGTNPSTLTLPQHDFVTPIRDLLKRVDKKQLREAAERAFGGPGLPYSASTPASKNLLPQKHIGLEAAQHRMSPIEADAFMAAVMPGVYVAGESVLVEIRKRLGSKWLRDLITKPGGPRVLDAGGAGAGLLAWKQLAMAEWSLLKDEGRVKAERPPGKWTVLSGSSCLTDRISAFLDDTTFLPRLPDYAHTMENYEDLLHGSAPQNRKVYDVIIASHTMFPLKDEWRRKHMVHNLWRMLEPKGGVLIFIEKGLPRGFEAIAAARQLLLKDYIPTTEADRTVPDSTPEGELVDPVEKEPGMIIAPCTNHSTCPMYPVPGLTPGRKDFCHFDQRFIRPTFLQRVMGASRRNHEDIKFSYIAVQRGIDGRTTDGVVQGPEALQAAFKGYEGNLDMKKFSVETREQEDVSMSGKLAELEAAAPKLHAQSLPRSILPPIKRRGHVTLDLCTPTGTLERWTVPRSFSVQAYRDARKSRWGDLWALGAKTRVERRARLGRIQADTSGLYPEEIDSKANPKQTKTIKSKTIKHVKKNKSATQYEVGVGEKGVEGVTKLTRGKVEREKRTKSGRYWKKPKGFGEGGEETLI